MGALTSRLPLDHCPRCQHKLDAATSMDYHTPKPGDLTVCINCAAICEWNQDMRLELFDPSKLRTIPIKTLVTLMNTVAAVGYVKPRVRHQWN